MLSRARTAPPTSSPSATPNSAPAAPARSSSFVTPPGSARAASARASPSVSPKSAPAGSTRALAPPRAADDDDALLDDLEGLEELEELAEAGMEMRAMEAQHEAMKPVDPHEAALTKACNALVKAIAENEAQISRLEELSELSDGEAANKLIQLKQSVEQQEEEMMIIKATMLDPKKEKKKKHKGNEPDKVRPLDPSPPPNGGAVCTAT